MIVNPAAAKAGSKMGQITDQTTLHHQGQGCRVSMLNVGIKPDYDNNIRIAYIMIYQYLAYIIFYIIFSTVVWLYQIKHLHIIYVILQGKRIYSS